MLALVVYVALSGQIHTESAAAFLRTMQQDNGGFITDQLSPDQVARPTLRTTRTAIRSFRMLGEDLPNREAIISFHASCYDEATGGFSAEPGGKPDPISTSVGLMILRELQLPTASYMDRGLAFMNQHTKGFEQVRMVASSLEEFSLTLPNSRRWASELIEQRNADGSFGSGPNYARMTGLYGVAIQRLGGKIDREATLKVLRAGQLADGGFGRQSADQSDLESCYRIVRLFHRLGGLPNRVTELREYIARCKNDDGGYGRTPEQASSLHGTYYANILTGWLNDLEEQNLEATRLVWTFDDRAAADELQHWIAAHTLPVPSTAWRIESSTLGSSEVNEATAEQASRGKVLVQVSTTGPSKQFNLCVVRDYRRLNVDLQVDVRARSGEVDQGGGVVWRYLDARNYYIARWNPLEDNLRVYKIVDGVRTQLDSAKVPKRSGWRSLRIVTYGRDIRGYLDGHLLLEAEDDQFDRPGQIGLWTKADAVTEFDNFHVCAAVANTLEELPTPQLMNQEPR